MERRRFSQTMASEWQTAFVVSHKMHWCALLTAVKNYNKNLKNCKTFSSRPRPTRPRPRLHNPRPRLSFLSSRRLETKTLVSRTTSLLESLELRRLLQDLVCTYKIMSTEPTANRRNFLLTTADGLKYVNAGNFLVVNSLPQSTSHNRSHISP